MIAAGPSYQERLDALRQTKLRHTAEKQQLIGAMDHDDWALILPPPQARKLVQTISGSGMPITDVKLKGYEPKPNHPSGGFFGPRAVGAQFVDDVDESRARAVFPGPDQGVAPDRVRHAAQFI